MSNDKRIVIKEVKWVISKKSTWTPKADFCEENPKYKPYEWQEVESFTLSDQEKQEHKLFDLKWKINLDFGDVWVLKVVFEKQ